MMNVINDSEVTYILLVLFRRVNTFCCVWLKLYRIESALLKDENIEQQLLNELNKELVALFITALQTDRLNYLRIELS